MRITSTIIRIAVLLLLIPGFRTMSSAQDIIRIGITKTDLSQWALKISAVESLIGMDFGQPNALVTLSDKLVDTYSSDPGFKVVDYRAYNLVSQERERQKDEAFIDGYIVEQGRNEGVNFILSPIYLVQENELVVRVIDIETGLVVCQAATPLIKNKTRPEYARYYSALLIQQLNNRCFNLEYPVVRVLKEKGGDAKEILVAYGSVHHAEEKQEVGIYKSTVEMVEGIELERQVQIAEGSVEMVEGDNFSIVAIKKGGDLIVRELASSVILNLRLLNNVKK